MATRSAQLAFASVPAEAVTDLYTCPAGITALLKGVTATQAPGASPYCELLVVNPAGVGVFLLSEATTTPLTQTWTGWYVLKPGDRVQAFPHVVSASVLVAGTELLEGT